MEAREKVWHFHYFHFYIKVGYYYGIVPFKLSLNHESGHYLISKVNQIHKVNF